MKSFLFLLAFIPVMACATQPSSNATQANAQAVAAPTSIAGSNSGANNQTINFNTPGATTSTITTNGNQTVNTNVSGTETLRNVPAVNAPPLTTSNDTCMGSVSAGGAVAGFGATFGKTYTDENCVMLKNSQQFWNYGMRSTAVLLMCQNAQNAKALAESNPPYYCPGYKPEKHVAKTETSSGIVDPQYTDPIIRARLGLPPIPKSMQAPQ